eukprot:COSAG04_NODE_2040_length_4948_cov_1.674572_2_plen_190_part_00
MLKNASGYYCYRYTPGDKWLLDSDFSPTESTCAGGMIVAKEGPLPVGAHTWRVDDGKGGWKDGTLTVGLLVRPPAALPSRLRPTALCAPLPCCLLSPSHAHFSSEGAVQTDAEVAAAEQRAKAAEAEAAAAAAKAFPKGTKVTWTRSDSDVPEGTVGTMLGPADDKPGYLRVEFPKGTWDFTTSELRRA